MLALGSQTRATPSTSGALARLQPLADAAALALDNVRLLQKTRELSITDEVTPLYNFRFFHQMLDRELKLVDRYRSVLSLIFLDLDRFKPINDQHGHLRGSRVLREVGFLLRAAVRETDYPARYGGDEFVVILPQTDGAAAGGLGEKLRRADRGAHLPAGGGHRRAPRACRWASPPIRPRRPPRRRSSAWPTSACTQTRTPAPARDDARETTAAPQQLDQPRRRLPRPRHGGRARLPGPRPAAGLRARSRSRTTRPTPPRRASASRAKASRSAG